MKKILLIGDSIKQGYDKYVAEALKGFAEVYYTNENGRFAEYVLRNLGEWKKELSLGEDIDLVHWNAGLWDSLILYREETLTPLNVYKEYVGRIMRRIKLLFPKAEIIFATSTPVLEDMFENPDEGIRYNADIERFNEAAVSEVAANGGKINDLYALLKDAPRSFHSDMTHFYTKEATEIITNQVISSILDCFSVPQNSIKFDMSQYNGENAIGY